MKMLNTDRMTLRELIEEDAGFILKLLNEPSFLQFIGDRGVRTIADTRSYLLNGPINSYRQFGFGLYLVELKDRKIPIGICGLVKRAGLEDADIGFAFLPDFWSKGYAFESAAAVLADARDVFGLNRVVAIVSPENERSIRVLIKLGFSFERLIRLSENNPELKLYVINYSIRNKK
jgi:RimJ/RimL family protein N-acetyltransferase